MRFSAISVRENVPHKLRDKGKTTEHLRLHGDVLQMAGSAQLQQRIFAG